MPTTIKIDAKDKDAIAKVCAMHSLEIYFLENVKGDLITCSIYSDSPAIMFYLGRSVQLQVEMNDLKTKYE